jgi:hypothetical protein
MTQRIENYLAAGDLTVDAPEDVEAATAYCLERSWGDGLPIVPPTPERVERMLRYCDRPWHRSIGLFPPRDGEITPIRLAANAVMAGCRPEYFPLVLLAVEAMCEPAFNLRGVQATTHPCTPLVIVNGPIGRELKVNGGHNAFGPGCQANATIGRALRLAMVNIGGAVPGLGDMATMGTPGKYTFVVAENEAESPWEPLHVERGFDREDTTVTVVAAEGPLNSNDHFSKDGFGILHTVAGTIANTGANNIYYKTEPVIAFSPEHALAVAGSGFSKRAAKDYLFEHGRIPLGRFAPAVIEERFRKREPQRYGDASLDTGVPVVREADDLLLIVLGGAGKHTMYLPTFGATRAVTRPLRLGDGRTARAIADFLQS